ncbi:AP-4 complex subunit mu [Acrasis kona]|uniref:AP-4 complex subunit mu n=1 Tax=Acrasis kona TaxID=1008807 RepID=A0AAW2ZLR9_9EUKA
MTQPSAISQFFILSIRGDRLVSRDFRSDIVKGAEEIFFSFISRNRSAPPVFMIEGINFLHIHKNGLHFVITTKFNMSPVSGFEYLNRCTIIIKDFTGQLSEDSIKMNLSLVYEILDELFDDGFMQTTSTSQLCSFVQNQPFVTVDLPSSSLLPSLVMEQKSVNSRATCRPITDKNNDIYVDILEKIDVEFNSEGSTIRSDVLGSIVMKSYLLGCPLLRLGFNTDLVIGRSKDYGVQIDSVNFCEFVNLSEFEQSRVLTLYPQDGEFTLMNYRVGTSYKNDMPFRIFTNVSGVGAFKIEIEVKIRADIPKTTHGSNLFIRIPLPRTTDNVVTTIGSLNTNQHSVEYRAYQKTVLWGIKKFSGMTEQFLRLSVSLSTPVNDLSIIKRQIGPVNMKFEIPMHNVSGVQLRFLKIGLDEISGKVSSKQSNVKRWVRYVTQANSYVSRVYKEN